MRLIAIDIGNTSIHGALWDGRVWKRHFRVSSRLNAAATKRLLLAGLGKDKQIPIALASVVPAKGKFVSTFLRAQNRQVLYIGHDAPVPIVNKYKKPKQVGVDRLLNALAAYRRYKKELIVIDFGTAITFDVVSRKGEYLGGVISPGIEISLQALYERTALLPKIQLKHPKHLLGQDTIESIRVGCSVGIGGLCDRIVEAFSKGSFRPTVIATGGYADFMKRYCHTVQKTHENLNLEGILATFQKRLTK